MNPRDILKENERLLKESKQEAEKLAMAYGLSQDWEKDRDEAERRHGAKLVKFFTK